MKRLIIAIIVLICIILIDYFLIKYDRHNIEVQINAIMHNKEEISDAVFGDINKYLKEGNSYTYLYSFQKEDDNLNELVYNRYGNSSLAMFGIDSSSMPLSSYSGAYKTVSLIIQGDNYVVKELLMSSLKIKNDSYHKINFKQATDKAYNIMLHGTPTFPQDSYIPNSAYDILQFPENIKTVFHSINYGWYENGTKKYFNKGAYVEDGYMHCNIDTITKSIYFNFDIDDFELMGSVFYLIIGSLISYILILILIFKKI